MRQPSRSRTVAAAIVVAAHLALLIAWMHDAVRPPGHAAPPRISVRLIAAAPPAPPPRPAEPATTAPARAPVRRAPPAARAEPPRRDAIAPQAITLQAIAPEPRGVADGHGGTRHHRARARQRGHAPRPARQSRATPASPREPGVSAPEPLTPDARLGAEVQQGAKGDCLKGEYLGGGMGLLSLPFLAAAALREQCRR